MENDFKILIYDKMSGETSFSSLYFLKKKFNTGHIGHTGTLDKFASGLMIALIGKATKLNGIFSSFDKSYRAQIEFGKETDTLDPEGTVIRASDIPERELLYREVMSLVGKSLQMPPIYSALHVNGKRSSDIARKGESVELKEREIEVYSVDIKSYEDGVLDLSLRVSKGTYIRSIAKTLGDNTRTSAYLKSLKRTSIGPFTLNDTSLTTDEILDKTDLFQDVYIKEEWLSRVRNGLRDISVLDITEPIVKPYIRLMTREGIFGYAKNEKEKFSLLVSL